MRNTEEEIYKGLLNLNRKKVSFNPFQQRVSLLQLSHCSLSQNNQFASPSFTYLLLYLNLGLTRNNFNHSLLANPMLCMGWSQHTTYDTVSICSKHYFLGEYLSEMCYFLFLSYLLDKKILRIIFGYLHLSCAFEKRNSWLQIYHSQFWKLS